MKPIEKAAQEAALAVAEIIEQARSVAYGGEASKDKIQQGANALAPIISHHLAPVQAELDAKDAIIERLIKSSPYKPELFATKEHHAGAVLDAKDKLIQDARYFVEHYNKFTAACMCEIDEKPCNACKAADWLARVKE